MGTVILVRHGRSIANAAHILAGRTAGVGLDARGRGQAAGLAGRLAAVPITAIACSPLQRCQETMAPLARARGLAVSVDDDLAEVDYGSWTGRALADLREDRLWRVVQDSPSTMVFPEGEAFASVWERATRAAHRWARADSVTVVCSHGDVLAMIVAEALGLALDEFQRLALAPASVSVIHYGTTRPMVLAVNSAGAVPWRPDPANTGGAPLAADGAGRASAAADAGHGPDLGGPAGT